MDNFNPRTPHGVRRASIAFSFVLLIISTHVPLTGYDLICFLFSRETTKFQPTYPSRGTTSKATIPGIPTKISTHVPLTGYDCLEGVSFMRYTISTHVPLTGYDHRTFDAMVSVLEFQPTYPSRGTTFDKIIFTSGNR